MKSAGFTLNRKAAKLAVIAMALFLPGLLLFPMGIGAVMYLFTYGVILGIAGAIVLGLSRGLLLVGCFALVNMVAFVASPHPITSALVISLTVLVYALTLRVGLASFIVVAPVSVAFTSLQPPSILPSSDMTVNVLVLAAVCVIAGLWGLASGTLIGRKVPRPPVVPASWRSTCIYAGALTLVCAGVAVIASLAHIDQDGAWILLTILIVAQPSLHRTRRKVGDRLLGTIIGFGVALVVGVPFSGHPVLLTLIAILLLGIAGYFMIAAQPYWFFVTFLTPSVVLLVGASTSILTTDINRVWSTIVGAALAVGVLVFLGAIGVHDLDEKDQTARP